jgi:hypothetical protein
MYRLNRDSSAKEQFKADPEKLLREFDLTEAEREAVLRRDIGFIYTLGVNGQLLMHFAALCGVEWADYLQRMRDGVRDHGPVQAGVYAMTTKPEDKIAGV